MDLYINFKNGHQLILRSYILSDFVEKCKNKKISTKNNFEIIKEESHSIDLDINLYGINFENGNLSLTLDDDKRTYPIDIDLGTVKCFDASI